MSTKTPLPTRVDSLEDIATAFYDEIKNVVYAVVDITSTCIPFIDSNLSFVNSFKRNEFPLDSYAFYNNRLPHDNVLNEGSPKQRISPSLKYNVPQKESDMSSTGVSNLFEEAKSARIASDLELN